MWSLWALPGLAPPLLLVESSTSGHQDLLFGAAHHPHPDHASPTPQPPPQCPLPLRPLLTPRLSPDDPQGAILLPHTLLLSPHGDPSAEALTGPAEQTQVPNVAFRPQSSACYLDQEAIKLLTQLLGQADRNSGLQKILYLRLNSLKPSPSPKVPQQARKCGEKVAAVLQQVKMTDCI